MEIPTFAAAVFGAGSLVTAVGNAFPALGMLPSMSGKDVLENTPNRELQGRGETASFPAHEFFGK